MVKIMFVCYGNICRSPMAEFMMKDYVKRMGKEDEFIISSSATHTDGLGCRPHRGTRAILDRLNIDYSGKVGVMLKREDLSLKHIKRLMNTVKREQCSLKVQ